MSRNFAQDDIFAAGEGDAWFRRNAHALAQDKERDPVLHALGLLPQAHLDEIGSVCDVGCSDGSRLGRLQALLPHARLAGFDASAEAIGRGKAARPKLDLRTGLVGEPPFAEAFGLVMISFVLHWVDRQLLTRVMAAVDGLVADGGLLVIADFLPDRPCRRRYHHRDDVELYTFKQDYPGAFTALATYRDLVRVTFDHSTAQLGSSSDQERAVCAVMQKSLRYADADA